MWCVGHDCASATDCHAMPMKIGSRSPWPCALFFVLHNTPCPARAVTEGRGKSGPEDAELHVEPHISCASSPPLRAAQVAHTSSVPGVSSISGIPPLPPGSRGPALSDHQPGQPLLLLLAQLRPSGHVQLVAPMPSPALDVWQEQRLQHPCVQLSYVHGSKGTLKSVAKPRTCTQVRTWYGGRDKWSKDCQRKRGQRKRGHIGTVARRNSTRMQDATALAPAIARVILQRESAPCTPAVAAQVAIIVVDRACASILARIV